MNQTDRELLGNLIILAAKFVYFIGTLLRSFLIVFAVLMVLIAAFQGDEYPASTDSQGSSVVAIAVLGYLVGRWHQARITKRRMKSNSPARKVA